MKMNLEYHKEPVFLTKEVAEMYKTTPRHIENNFLQHEERFEEGEHYYLIENEEFNIFKTVYPKAVNEWENHVYLWTEEGLLKHAQLMKGIQAWEVFNYYISYYFKNSKEVKDALSTIQKAADQILKERFLYCLAKELYSYDVPFE